MELKSTETQNLAETLAKEMKAPIEIISEPGGNMKRVALPPGWSLVEKDDDSKLLATPRRKLAKVRLHDADNRSLSRWLTARNRPVAQNQCC